MKRLALVFSSCLLLPLTLLAASVADEDVIAYRQDVMKTLDEQSSALGQIASGVIPTDNLNAHMEILALAAATALKAFEAKVPGGEAKPEIWANWSDFSAKMTDFVQKADAGVKAAKGGNMDSVTPALVDLADSCKGCHEMYREDKKK